MIELQGAITKAKVFTDNIEETAVGQVIGMLSEKITEDTQVRIMPDVHAGKGSTIGTTIMAKNGFNKVSPNVVGVDIGCGIAMWKVDIEKNHVDFEKLDNVIQAKVPSGFSVFDVVSDDKSSAYIKEIGLDNLTLDLEDKKIQHILKSVGTLGGGNHYIELAEDNDGGIWLSVHSGSRNLGVQVATLHQKVAEEKCLDIKNKNLAYLTGSELDDYLKDMSIAQRYALLNRKEMLNSIIEEMGWKVLDNFDSIHNYIDIENNIIRKGATSAQKGERLVIPLNMRDGSLICMGKGNSDWNFSAPHGAGRTMSRSQAKREIDLDKYTEQMKDVYTTSVGQSTLDEAPDAYKSADEIIENIRDTADVVHHLRPLYNFKNH